MFTVKFRIIFCSLIVGLFLKAGVVPEIYSQQSSVLRVVVISDDDGNPIIGANVLLYEEDDLDREEFIRAGVTDGDGLTEIRGIEPGTYHLRISSIGHRTYDETITLEPDEIKVHRVVLEVDVEEFEEVVVEERRQITTGEVGIHRITDVEIGRIPTPGPGGDLATYLQTLPGVVASGDRGGELYIRGGNPYQNRVLVDNLPILKPFHVSNLFSAFSQEMIQSVDMYAGGFGANYLDATSSVIDVRLRPGNMRRHSSSLAVSPYMAALKLEGPLERNRQSVLISGRKSTIERMAPTFTGEEQPIEFYDIVSRYTYQADNFNCSFTGVRTYDRGQINPLRDVSLSWSNTVLGARCLGFDEWFNHPVEFTAGFTGFTNREGTTEQTERLSQIRQFYYDVELRQTIFNQPLQYGFTIDFHFYNAELAERFADVETFDKTLATFRSYGALEWHVNDKLTIHPSIGMQVLLEQNPTFEPRIRAAYRPFGSDRQELSLAAGYYTQQFSGITDERDAGTVFTVWKPVDMDDPLPRSLHGILGYRHQFGRSITAHIEGFVKQHKNIPVSKWTPEARLEIETALAHGYAHGADARIELDLSSFYLAMGYGWSVVEYEAAADDLGAWLDRPIFQYSPPHDQRHKFNTILSYQFAGFQASLRWEYGSGTPYTQVFGFDMAVRVPNEHPLRDPGRARTLFSEPYSERLPVYHRLDVSIERDFQITSIWNLNLEAGVINMYDRNNIFYFDLNTLQRVDQTSLFPYVSIQTELR